MYGYGHIGMAWGELWMILIWIAPILLVVLIIRHATNDHADKSAHIALEILEARHTRGAIDQEEYLKRRAELMRLGRL